MLLIRFSLGDQPPSGGCVLKLNYNNQPGKVELDQPPSGGCVLKPFMGLVVCGCIHQPPSGGCVLKLSCCSGVLGYEAIQPPSGGCVLKPNRRAG